MAALLEEKPEPAAVVNLLDPNYDYAPAVMPPSFTTVVHLIAGGVEMGTASSLQRRL
jgi:hypothetical protein